ncbi:hypothetical protein [Roseibium sp. RKSG952]|uniref:hypothetical protein n=1 Tax=Roseibium sp. RKSG952 TaxID=2529384 RepID=UPI0012BC55BD|nr:hypothetical protein [Roseibium sp. RKSG952]MTI03235.1 hypothetical protein [Roseibium sp. RKSG952]
MAQMSTNLPARKVVFGSVGAAVATVFIYVVEEFLLGATLPGAVSAALITIIVFLVGYFVPPSANDGIITDDQGVNAHGT